MAEPWFEPVAIVGRGCVLPGAHTPAALWQAAREQRNLLTAPPKEVWGVTDAEQAAYGYRGGFITGFDQIFDAARYQTGGISLDDVDVGVRWLLHAAYVALDEAGNPQVTPDRLGVIIGNLGYPSRALSDYAADIWMDETSRVYPVNRNCSSLPAEMLARSLGGAAIRFCLDAACASSLYAIRLACDALQAGEIDLAVVGGLNATDNLILHQGFRALNALSPTGRSRPFTTDADGLVPSEGAAAIVLKRLADIETGEHVFGVIRGVGLSNDGARRGLLAPDATGQAEAIGAAYAMAGLTPDGAVDFVECHATGTPTGDPTELDALAEIFGSGSGLPIGSLKSNLGHSITVAGLASLIYLTEALGEETLPPTRLDGDVLNKCAALGLSPLTTPKPWPRGERPRRAGLSNFGFGGNNAHLVLEAARSEAHTRSAETRTAKPRKVDVVGIGVLAGPDRGLKAVTRRLMRARQAAPDAETILANPRDLKTPPTDLDCAQAQQLAVFDAVDEALTGVTVCPAERIGCFVGLETAPDGARSMLSARIAKRMGLTDADEIHSARDAVSEPLAAGHVTGAMANISANRLSAARDWRGPSFSISAGHQSGAVALNLAVQAIARGDIDMAIVAAADMATDQVNRAAVATPERMGDGAGALVLKARKLAKADGERTLAELDTSDTKRLAAPEHLREVYGRMGIAEPLVRMALGLGLGARGLALTNAGVAPVKRRKLSLVPSLTARIRPCATADIIHPPLQIAFASADTRSRLITELLRGVEVGAPPGKGACRLALVARHGTPIEYVAETAVDALRDGRTPAGDGIYFGEGPPEGDLAFVFTGAAAVYPGAGLGLFSALPGLASELITTMQAKASTLDALAGPLETPYSQLTASTLVSQAQALVLRDMLGVAPSVAMGLSSGETNSLVAFGAWSDPAGLLKAIAESGMYETYIGGQFQSACEAWGTQQVDWQNWRLLVPVEDVRAVIADQAKVELTIIYGRADCVIGGEAEACAAVIHTLGKQRAIRVDHDLVVHAGAMVPYAPLWRNLHTRPTKAPKGLTFYTNHGNCAYKPTRKSVAEALTGQACATVDFPSTIERAYANGVRSFVEIGPRDTLTRAISEILGNRPHLAIAADRADRGDINQLFEVCAALYAEGRAVDVRQVQNLSQTLASETWPHRAKPTPLYTKPIHTPVPRTPLPQPTTAKPMQPAPPLCAPTYPPSQSMRAITPLARAEPKLTKPVAINGVMVSPERAPTGPAFDRAQLEHSAVGKISELYGQLFEQQDQYARQVRMPRPPLLLADRITGIDAEPGVAGVGTIWTETDVTADHWAVHDGFMRPGPIIEAGQADLALISYMGADFLNKGERVYRLLGCELTFHGGGLPRIGDTLRFQITIKGHAELGGVRMFFFEYDARIGDRLFLSVRSGQAGFFTDEELAGSKGVLWDPETEGPPTSEPRLDYASTPSPKRSFTADEVAAFRAGDTYECFGETFKRAAAHSKTAKSPDGRLALFDSVDAFDPTGGPWGRGYLRTRSHVPRDAWFYDGHFHNDPCMPGTLMAEAAVQALEFYAAALGLTVERDGYVFEPVEGYAAKFFCRGQVTPDADHEVTYEIFIDEVIDGPQPEIYAALLARSDGNKVFYSPRFGIRLRPNWPARRQTVPHRIISPEGDVRGDEDALLECADGAPSHAFGTLYAPLDTEGRSPRLPQPPYHTISRVISVSGPAGQQGADIEIVAEYDIPPDAWYFEDGGNGAMPFGVLTEILLQPCGWLASYCGFNFAGGAMFRNLDGDGVIAREIWPDDGLIRVKTRLTRFSKVGPLTIVFFELTAHLGTGELVATLTTSFGFFTEAALANQTGLKVEPHHREAIDLTSAPAPVPGTRKGLTDGKLVMVDKVDHWSPTSGAEGLGLIRGRQSVDPRAWYFKAHFFSDPVQPGSLGLNALTELLARATQLKGLCDRFEVPRFESVAVDEQVTWTYRGQVTPEKEEVTTVIELVDVEVSPSGTLVRAVGSLWCDGLRIYETPNLAIRIVEGTCEAEVRRETFSQTTTPWINDHCPTLGPPALPLMALGGLALRTATGSVAGLPATLTGFTLDRWANVPKTGCTIETRQSDGAVTMRWREGETAGTNWHALGAGEVATTKPNGRRKLTRSPKETETIKNLYKRLGLFHGPAFQLVRKARLGSRWAETEIDLTRLSAPGDPFDPLLLDALVHAVPRETPEDWFDIGPGHVLFPTEIVELSIFDQVPSNGMLSVRTVPEPGLDEKGGFGVRVEASGADGLLIRLLYREKPFAKGPFAALTAAQRIAFARGGKLAAKHRTPLSSHDNGTTQLSPADVAAADWMPGTVAALYGAGQLAGTKLVQAVAIKEHFARAWACHPADIAADPPFASGPDHPRTRYELSFDRNARAWAVSKEPDYD